MKLLKYFLLIANRMLCNQRGGIGGNDTDLGYEVVENGIRYFVFGNTRIRITEHFPENGKQIGELIEEIVEYSARKTEPDKPIRSA